MVRQSEMSWASKGPVIVNVFVLSLFHVRRLRDLSLKGLLATVLNHLRSLLKLFAIAKAGGPAVQILTPPRKFRGVVSTSSAYPAFVLCHNGLFVDWWRVGMRQASLFEDSSVRQQS